MDEIGKLPAHGIRSTIRMPSMAQGLSRAQSAVDDREGRSDAELQGASQQFEALLLNTMVREMRATVPESALFPPSMAQALFTEMLDEQIAGEMSRHGGIGLARLIFDQLKGGR